MQRKRREWPSRAQYLSITLPMQQARFYIHIIPEFFSRMSTDINILTYQIFTFRKNRPTEYLAVSVCRWRGRINVRSPLPCACIRPPAISKCTFCLWIRTYLHSALRHAFSFVVMMNFCSFDLSDVGLLVASPSVDSSFHKTKARSSAEL